MTTNIVLNANTIALGNDRNKIKYKYTVNSVKKMSFLHISLRNTLTLINSLNNTFKFTRSSSYTITLTNGNYSPAELATHIQTIMNVALSGFTVVYSSITGKLTFSHVSAFTLDFASLDHSKNNIAQILGFIDGTSTASGTSSTSSYQVDLLQNRIIYFCSPQLSKFRNINTEGYQDVFYVLPISDNMENQTISLIFDQEKQYASSKFQSFNEIDISIYQQKKQLYNSSELDYSIGINFD